MRSIQYLSHESGSVQEMCGCGTEGHDQWAWCDELVPGLSDLKDLFQP